VSLIARGLEQAGIPTALVSVMPPLSSTARPPRQVIRKLNIGATVGRPNDIDTQLDTLRKMVALIENAPSFGAVDSEA
jgi:D-proline reductase (dithiol) PrdB